MFRPPERRTIVIILRIAVPIALIVWAASGLMKKQLGFSSYREIDARRYANARSLNVEPATGLARLVNFLHLRRPIADVAVVYAEGEEQLCMGIAIALAEPGSPLGASSHWRSSLIGRVQPDICQTPSGSIDSVVTPKGREPVQLRLHWFRTGNTAVQIKDQAGIARRLARDDRYLAVIGHSTSEVAELASVSYEYTNLLYIATTATDPVLTRHGFGSAFRTIGTDEELSQQLAELCSWLEKTDPKTHKLLPVKSVGVFYEQSPHSTNAVEDLESALADRSLATIFEKPYEPLLGSGVGSQFEQRQRAARLHDQIAAVEHLTPDMIAIIGDGVPAARQVWNGLSRSNLSNVPIVLFGGPLDANAFIDFTERETNPAHPENSYPAILTLKNEGDQKIGYDEEIEAQRIIHEDRRIEPGAIYLATQFSVAEVDLLKNSALGLKLRPEKSTEQAEAVKKFEERYRVRFDNDNNPKAVRAPEALALRGYAAGRVLKEAFELSRSLAPIDVEEALKSSHNKFTALGRRFSFDINGDEKDLGMPDMPIIYKRFLAAKKK
jgi:hypothetical protein